MNAVRNIAARITIQRPVEQEIARKCAPESFGRENETFLLLKDRRNFVANEGFELLLFYTSG
jgi:hypothetical protein